MALLTSHPETLRDLINAIPAERIREHIRASAYWHWRGPESGRAIIADGCDMKQALPSFARSDEFHFYAAKIGFKASIIARCVSRIRAADKAEGKLQRNPDHRFYNDAARKRLQKKEALQKRAEAWREKNGVGA